MGAGEGEDLHRVRRRRISGRPPRLHTRGPPALTRATPRGRQPESHSVPLSQAELYAAARMRSTCFGVLTPFTSRYATIETSAIADGRVTKVLIFSPRSKSGTRNTASKPTM